MNILFNRRMGKIISAKGAGDDGALVKTIQEQKEMIYALKHQNEELKTANEARTSETESLKSSIEELKELMDKQQAQIDGLRGVSKE